MYSNKKATVNGVAFNTARRQTEHLSTEAGTTGYKDDETRFCLKIAIPPETDMVGFEIDDWIVIAGSGVTSLHEMYSSLKFAIKQLRKQIKEASNAGN